MRKKIETNVDLVKHLMTFSPTGAISQFFILDAIKKFADTVADAEKPEEWNSFITWEAWKKTAEFIKHEIERRD